MGSGKIRKTLKQKFKYGSCQRKQRYATESGAGASAETRSKQTGTDLRAYSCVFCKGWHIGSPREWEKDMNAPELRAKIQELCHERNVLREELRDLRREMNQLEKALAQAPAEVCEMCEAELVERLNTPREQCIPAEEVFRKYGLET